jgi:hypothetical protein
MTDTAVAVLEADVEPVPAPEAGTPAADRSRFGTGVLVIALGGLALRIGMILSRPPCPPGTADGSSCFTGANDAIFYHDQANLFADHVWFRASNSFDLPELVGGTHPTAFHPPLYSLYLGFVSWIGGHTITSHRVASAVLGAVTIVLFAVLVRKLAGPRAGLVAAGIAALYPALWINDTVLMSESMYALVLVVFLLLAYRLWEEPRRGRAFALGAAIGVAALTRSEAVLLLPFVALPLALGARGLAREARVRLLVIATAALLLFLGPWVVFNLTRFEEPTFLSTSAGTFLNLGNCDETYYDPDLMGFPYSCDIIGGQPALAEMDESERDAVLRDRSVAYIRDNLGRAPLVAVVRAARTFGVWKPTNQVEADWRFENRGRAASSAGLLAYYAALPFALAGGVALWRRRVAVSPLVGLIALSVIAVMGVHTLTRVRLAADVAIVVLAAIGIEVLLRRYFPGEGGIAFEQSASPVEPVELPGDDASRSDQPATG